MIVWECIDKLVDRGSFYEIGVVLGIGEYDFGGDLKKLMLVNCVFGCVCVDGWMVVVVGDDFMVCGGFVDVLILVKLLMVEEMVYDLCLLIICIIEGLGGGGLVKIIEIKGVVNLLGGIGGMCWYCFMIENLLCVLVVVFGFGLVVGFGVVWLVVSYYLIMMWKFVMFVVGFLVVKVFG